MSESGQKASKGSIKPLGFTTPYYLYIYAILVRFFFRLLGLKSINMGTPYKISSQILVLASLRTGIFTVECVCPEPFRLIDSRQFRLQET
jgi:hypothetical protein